ncbi:MAG: UDP-glucose/GDP-mannose dehydrogenase family protein [Candidatus Omnitrophica bacterium]|nr:UDP-glucose/GDP-mannose dehydrogenase family protein [Candidatus Omnitrophota bacterium]MBI2173902.1 UDP-glucose/GDP-mannose dehydrogenase family protein [Candidatus Omnitrophota bacterium]MBI3010620.1 UDP-glucose/GDP-mannose dehydrogenase family protein [Candidatus Omnitrophota bacterium]
MDIAVVGAGHVGLVTGACFADLGHRVLMMDNDAKRIAQLRRNQMPFYEPGLEELVARGVREKRLRFTTSMKEAVKGSAILFIAVGTPQKTNGEADLTYVEAVARSISLHLDGYRLVVEKSTVPVQTGQWVAHTIRTYLKKKHAFDVASNPEFLREGTAIADFMKPDRVVLGVESQRAKELLMRLYKPLGAPILVTDISSAELIKHASNSFLSMKISFINAVAQVCERCGADVAQVAEGMGLDGRIGRSFLNAGVGFGGFCFPKDLDAFIKISEQLGYDFDLLKAVRGINEYQKRSFIEKIRSALWVVKGKQIGVLGLAFKPNTDDMRYAPSLDVIRSLLEEGAKVCVFDPQAMQEASHLLPGAKLCKDAYEVARGSDCLAILTEWNEFKELDFARIKKLMRQPLVIDGRNIYDPSRMRALGYRYLGVGRKQKEPLRRN